MSGLQKARYIMVGGFLGAGKSTSIARLGHYLGNDGVRVGLITNDQGFGLVDTAVLKSHGFPVEEIGGGCFCCRFGSLTEAADRLSSRSKPEVFIAEPVGSCTDLVASVTYPLRRIYGKNFTIAPLSVLVDPIRALRILGVEKGRRPFSEKVLYVYRKQLEEADAIVINKTDLLTPAQLDSLQETVKSIFPESRLFLVSARTGQGLESWFSWITTREQRVRPSLELDYEIYSEGEAALGWLNCTIRVDASESFDADVLLEDFASAIQARLNRDGVEVAHLKMTFSPVEDFNGEIAFLSLARNDYVPELSQRLWEWVGGGELIVNLRAEGEPERLQETVEQVLEKIRTNNHQMTLDVEHLERFRPAKPQPTYRIAGPEEIEAGEGVSARRRLPV